MATVFPTYPATTFEQAVDLAIFSANQLHNVINEDATTEIETENGYIPSLRKALTDNFYFKSPIVWSEGTEVTVFNQLYIYTSTDTDVSGFYYAPAATSASPITMGTSPEGDANFVLYSASSSIKPEAFSSGITISTYGRIYYSTDSNGVYGTYIYIGSALPYTTTAATPEDDQAGVWTPDNTTGIWLKLGESNAYSIFTSTSGATKVGTSDGSNVQAYIDTITAEIATINTSLSEVVTLTDLASTESDKGTALVGHLNGGRLDEYLTFVTPQSQGSPCNGTDDDTSYFSSMITTYRNIRIPAGSYVLDCNSITVPSNTKIIIEPGAIITIKNTSGTSGSGYAAKVFTIVGTSSSTVSSVYIEGGNFTYTDDSIAIVGVGSYTSAVMVTGITCTGARLIDVSDSVSSSYTDSTSTSRPAQVQVNQCVATMTTLSSKGACINFRLVENCSTYKNFIYGYQYGIQWSGGDAAVYTDLSYERKCKSLRISYDTITAKYAGIWGSMGDDVQVSFAHVTSTDTTASDVGIDFEGCTNSGATSCYVYGFTQGNLATYFINNGVKFSKCVSIAPSGCRAARINNSLQTATNTNISFDSCYFKGDSAGSKLAQAGAVDNLKVTNCIFEDVYMAMASNNNGSIFVHDNQFRFTMVPSDAADSTHTIYAALFIGYTNNNERLISLKNNTFYSSVSWTALTTNCAICVVSNNYNNYTRVEIQGGGTYSTSWTSDISLYNGGSNTGITIAYDVTDFTFANKSFICSIVDSASLYPIGRFSGRTTGYINFPASITDNATYASCYYTRGQKFIVNTPSAGGVAEYIVTASGLGNACTVKNLVLTT